MRGMLAGGRCLADLMLATGPFSCEGRGRSAAARSCWRLEGGLLPGLLRCSFADCLAPSTSADPRPLFSAAANEEVQWMLRDERLQKVVADIDAAPGRERVSTWCTWWFIEEVLRGLAW